MKKNKTGEAGQEPELADGADKAGWLRRFCGKGVFREIWRSRFVVLKEEQLMLCEKEGHGAGEVLDLSHFRGCDDVKNPKRKSRGKKDRSKFALQRCPATHETGVDVLFLAVSPEDKESWINVLNGAIARAKNKVLDQVTAEEARLHHPTRERARLRHGRRPPSRAHLLAAASWSEGTATPDLTEETEEPASEDGGESPPASDGALSDPAPGKCRSLPREARAAAAAESGKSLEKRRASAGEIWSDEKRGDASADEIRSRASSSEGRLRSLLGPEAARARRLLAEATARDPAEGTRTAEEMREEASRLLREALEALERAGRLLNEAERLRELCRGDGGERPIVPPEAGSSDGPAFVGHLSVTP
ncbi:pleckstrin homology domain-containing family O member 1b [Stigmatopora argus]